MIKRLKEKFNISKSLLEFKNWASYAPYKYFHIILEEWEKACKT